MSLTGKQRRYLRGLAHHLRADVQVGNAGLSDALVDKVDRELGHHELIKIRVGAADMTTKEAAKYLAEKTSSHVVQTIGHTVVLYREADEDPEIHLPKA